MHAQPNDALTVSTVLVSDREQFRTMVLDRLAAAAERLGDRAELASRRQRYDGVLKLHERCITEQLAEIESCRELLGQVGWRD